MKRFSKLEYLVIIILLVVVIAGGYFSWKSGKIGRNTTVKMKNYSAVFLTNGQVYFGKIEKSDKNYTTIKDIYYLQVQQALQPPAEKKNEQEQPKISLVKLGEEIHGPKDEMKISNLQILFIEDLKEEGQVVSTIKTHKEGKITPETTTTAPSQKTNR